MGLYPDIPRPKQFEEIIKKEWKKKYPHVKLNFQNSWDGGYNTQPENLDVFIFDAAFLNEYILKGYLLSLKKNEINAFDDLLFYAKQGVKDENSRSYFGIPQIACRSLLFFRKGDSQLEKAHTLNKLLEVIGENTFEEVLPPLGKGLMMDFSSSTTNAYYYLEAVEHLSKDTLHPHTSIKQQKSCPISNISILHKMSSLNT